MPPDEDERPGIAALLSAVAAGDTAHEERHRAVLIARHAGLSWRQLAKITGVPPSTLRGWARSTKGAAS